MLDFSFIITAHDVEEYIDECLASALRQIGDLAYEVLVLDDGSNDSTGDRIAAIEDERLIKFSVPSPLGRADGRNLLAAKARGRYLAILDADDIAAADRLARTHEAIQSAARRPGVVSGQCIALDSRFGAWRHHRYPTTRHDIDAAVKRFEMPICHTGCSIERASFELVNGYDPAYSRGQDLDLIIRLVAAGVDVCNMESDVAVYRHDIAVSWDYWLQSRKTDYALRGLPMPGSLASRVRYAGARLRRVKQYLRTHAAAERDLKAFCADATARGGGQP